MTSLREAIVVFICLTFVAFFNLGQTWEGHKTSLQYVNWELNGLLRLNITQMEKINAINTKYDFELGKIKGNETWSEQQKEEVSAKLLLSRNEEIMKILDDRQQELLYAYCADLLTF